MSSGWEDAQDVVELNVLGTGFPRWQTEKLPHV